MMESRDLHIVIYLYLYVASCPSDLPAFAHFSNAPPVVRMSANNAGILTS
jgi:hypothetical protein